MGVIYSYLEYFYPTTSATPKAGSSITAKDATVSGDSTIKYLPDNGPPVPLGPSPGVAEKKPTIDGVPTIKVPLDTSTKVSENSSIYDTISMTPDVDWEKKNSSVKSK